MKTRLLIILSASLICGCSNRPPSVSAPAVSTAALSSHLTSAQQGVSDAQSALSPNDGKAAVIKQWLNQN